MRTLMGFASALLLLSCSSRSAPLPGYPSQAAWTEMAERAKARLESREAAKGTGSVDERRLRFDRRGRTEGDSHGFNITLTGGRCYETAIAGDPESAVDVDVSTSHWAKKYPFAEDGTVLFDFCLDGPQDETVHILPTSSRKEEHRHFALAMRGHQLQSSSAR